MIRFMDLVDFKSKAVRIILKEVQSWSFLVQILDGTMCYIYTQTHTLYTTILVSFV